MPNSWNGEVNQALSVRKTADVFRNNPLVTHRHRSVRLRTDALLRGCQNVIGKQLAALTRAGQTTTRSGRDEAAGKLVQYGSGRPRTH